MTVEAMKAGAIDFLTKPVRDQTLLDAITTRIAHDADRRAEAEMTRRHVERVATLTPLSLRCWIRWRVVGVKAWAVDKFGLTPHDAAEHVLQMCGTTRRPSSDTPLDELTDGRTCSVCFDLVPEKRVEAEP